MAYYKKESGKLQDIMDDYNNAKKGIKSLTENHAYIRAVQFARKIIKLAVSEANRSWADQTYRAGTSVAANIAEGIGRGTVPMHIQFLRIARGSAFEMVSWLQLAPAELDSVKDELLKDLFVLVRAIEQDIMAG